MAAAESKQTCPLRLHIAGKMASSASDQQWRIESL